MVHREKNPWKLVTWPLVQGPRAVDEDGEATRARELHSRGRYVHHTEDRSENVTTWMGKRVERRVVNHGLVRSTDTLSGLCGSSTGFLSFLFSFFPPPPLPLLRILLG